MTVTPEVAEARAIAHLLTNVFREHAVLRRHTPPAVLDLYRGLCNAIDVSSRRHENDRDRGELNVSRIGTRLAADILGWDMRRVQRHRADLGGVL
jgi:hypothetical protein